MHYHKEFDPPRHPDATPTAAATVGDRRDGAGYVYTPDIVLAVNVALATGRPLLVRGRSGCGKSSLASHVAKVLRWRYLERVITSRTQAQDLLWEVDHLQRLRDAQANQLRPVAHYVRPGILWHAFDPAGAEHQSKRAGDRRVASKSETAPDSMPDRETDIAQDVKENEASFPRTVVLLDEIDKADPDVPNNLLVALGSLLFEVEETGEKVKTSAERAPLLILTTNDERDLPEAFLRRCVQLKLSAPDRNDLTEIGCLHFNALPRDEISNLAEWVLEIAPEVSTAEFLDTVRACQKLKVGSDPEAWKQIVHVTVRRDGRSPTSP